MTIEKCSLSHPIHLVIRPGRFDKAKEEYPDAVPPTEEIVRQDLLTLSDSGVPTFLSTASWGELQVIFCTRRYEIVCGLTDQGDGYFVHHVAPLSLRSHNQIARQMVALRVPDWYIHWDVSELGRLKQKTTLQSGFAKIEAAWTKAEQTTKESQPQPDTLSTAHLAFLSDVETLIELAYKAEVDRMAHRGYTSVIGPPEPVAQARFAGDVYRFTLAGNSDLQENDYVMAGVGTPGEQGAGYLGVVTEATEQSLTVRFHHQVDLSRLKRVEWLIPSASRKQYDIQKSALAALRHNNSTNSHLLKIIVDGQFQPYQEKLSGAQSSDAQSKMISRADQVPDMLLVWGPPGTGKTTTISAVVTQQAAKKKRILITSKNNKAVDNVLQKLENVDALRIGREEAISAEVRQLMIDEQARKLQEEVLTNIAPTLNGLDTIKKLWSQLESRLQDLTQCATTWRKNQKRLEQELKNITDWQTERYAEVEPVIKRQLQRFRTAHSQAIQACRQANFWRIGVNFTSTLGRIPGIGPLFIIIAGWLDNRWQQSAQPYKQATREMGRVANQIRQVWAAYHHAVSEGDEALQRKSTVARTEQDLMQVQAEITRKAAELSQIMARFEGIPFLEGLPPLNDLTRSAESIEVTCQKIQRWYEALAPRRTLLHDWYDLLQTRHQALYPSLIRTVDVVGATCIGIATNANFEDLEFDLVIADEAGQIQVMDLLVPLVRAKRAILVGDHQQLPPVVEDKVAKQIDHEEFQRAWLEQSLFEQLFERPTTPDTHKVILDTQRRMPRFIADFISHQFYQDNYRTGRDVPYTDPFFDGPMVYIDTVKERERYERPAVEPDGVRGYINHLEVQLIAQVALAYQRQSEEWGVIVPYKKQAEQIRRELFRRNREFSQDFLNDWVATVDSFQGKERDVIIYGFTRSNTKRQVGFMAELRRLNVSLTRARRQLVLMGDSGTLTRAKDVPFARLMQALLETVKVTPGGYLHAHELQRRLRV
ncbi:MAG: AAA domain-containing protein [Nitrososphaera sp.]|nr:AAA domain-containing protein [Nitrososphaera sp.]